MNENWVFTEKNEYRDEAQAVLDRVKAARSGKEYRLVRIDPVTWKEIEIKEPLNNDKTWKK